MHKFLSVNKRKPQKWKVFAVETALAWILFTLWIRVFNFHLQIQAES
jgi:hypothetical protein